MTEKGNKGVIFNRKVVLFLRRRELKSQKHIFKMDGMRHIIRLPNDRPEDFELKIKFSYILLNFSREIPNLKIGAIFSVFVKPFFYLLDFIITNELKLFLRNK